MFFYFKVTSKDDQVLNKFGMFLTTLETLTTTIKPFSKRKENKVITILKSPHVNKTAQEQFEFRFYSKEFLIHSVKPLTLYTILKQIKSLSFPGVKLETKSLFDVSKLHFDSLRGLDPDNVILDKKGENQRKYIQLFDGYGESFLKNSLYLKN